MSLLYFAYGSNLHPARLAERAASSVCVGAARLADHALRFHKRGADDSAKCDVVPAHGGAVFGALFRMDECDLESLDAAEQGYDRFWVRVSAGAGVQDAFTYRARPERVTPALAPYRWYRDLVVLGARHHALPPDYVAALEAVAVREDPDPARARAMDALLVRLRE